VSKVVSKVVSTVVSTAVSKEVSKVVSTPARPPPPMAAYPTAVHLKDWYLRRLGKDEAGGVRVAVEGMRCDERAGAFALT
jgi:hypothetical protein